MKRRELKKGEQVLVISKKGYSSTGPEVGKLIEVIEDYPDAELTRIPGKDGDTGNTERNSLLAIGDLVYKQNMVGKVEAIHGDHAISIQWKPGTSLVRHEVLDDDGTSKWHHAPEGLKQGDKLDGKQETTEGLRALEKDEQVLVVSKKGSSRGPVIGELVKVIEDHGPATHVLRDCDDEHTTRRSSLLAIGDKVVRGPDMGKNTNVNAEKYTGIVGVVTKLYEHGDRCVGVDWQGGPTCTSWRMTPDHQDLKPTGDSADTGDSKPECFGENNCPEELGTNDCLTCYKGTASGNCTCKQCLVEEKCNDKWDDDGQPRIPNKPNDGCSREAVEDSKDGCGVYAPKDHMEYCKNFKPKEDVMSETMERYNRARKIKEELLPQAQDKVAAAEDNISELKDEMQRLMDNPTLLREKIAVLTKATGSAEQAEAALRAVDLGLPITITINAAKS